jgi:hypothetical protein
MRQRQPRYENEKLRKLCHEAPSCFISIPDICTGYPCECVHDDSQKAGRGFSYKSHDYNAVPGCRACHLAYGRSARDYQELVDRAADDWRYYLWMNKLIKVA